MNHRCNREGEGLAAAINYTPNSSMIKLLSVLFTVQWANSSPLIPCKAMLVSRMHRWIIVDFIALLCRTYRYCCAPRVFLKTIVESLKHEVTPPFPCWMSNRDQDTACPGRKPSQLVSHGKCSICQDFKARQFRMMCHLSLSDDTVHHSPEFAYKIPISVQEFLQFDRFLQLMESLRWKLWIF